MFSALSLSKFISHKHFDIRCSVVINTGVTSKKLRRILSPRWHSLEGKQKERGRNPENTQGLEHMCSKTSYDHRNTWDHKTSHEVAVQTRKGHTETLSFNKHFCDIALHPKLSCGNNWDQFDIFEQLH